MPASVQALAEYDDRHAERPLRASLSELGTVTDTYEEPKSFSRFNGNPVVTFAVFRSKGASEVSVAETVAAALDEVRAKNAGRLDRADRRRGLFHLWQL